ncbi:uncharacterized protein MELLADRAFT_65352 [Melampsora larici-populina 98AG31]|uniref:UBC core domain-containing protein n=1 Tax=Melampsora larici-populina (strain 98AG31 / pathotype 3-4-7) TaxID=747676 RepID=F4RV07_MELLP|nr:uncharacterized protein MELLADRAFT_65352 [Melampsora larici-populina 98AG31]EGG03790.1 hypothetical protein MELLADRAFT_65352 [Melampsora larici-populina 98AG31]
MDPNLITQLMEMGASRSAAISALRASKGDVNEAAIVVFDPLHAEATFSDADSQLIIDGPTGSTSKLPKVNDEDAQDDEMTSIEAESDDGGIHEEIDFFEDDVEEVGADPFAQISFQKDRKEIMLEIEETPEKVELNINQVREPAIIMPQSQWMKGCAEGNEQSFLFQIYSRLTDTECSCVADKCNGIIQRQRTDFFAIPNTFALYIQHLEQVVQAKCPDCGRVICLACSDEVTAPSSSKEPSLAGDTSAALLHCPDLQAVILGVGLSLVEKMYYVTPQPESLPSPEMRPSKKTKLDTPPINENDSSENESLEITHHGHARGVRSGPKGVGYGGASYGSDDQSGQQAASLMQKMQDQSLASLLASIRVFMPNRSRKGPFRSSDHMPSIATAIHIRRRFNPIASDLLKNDSLSDMSDRRVLYEEFLEWLLIVSAHENLGSIMGQPIMRETSSRYLPATANSTGQGTREKEITYEGSAGPRELLENLSRQVKAARHAMRHPESESQLKKAPSLYHLSRDKEDKEVEKLESFCERFEKAVASIDLSLESNNNHHVIEAIKSLNRMHVPVSNDLSSVSLEILQTRYVKWAESVKYEVEFDHQIPSPPEEAPVDGVTRPTESVPSLSSNAPKYLHAYAREIQNTFSYPARNTAIAREHSTLIGALPISWDSSVFLRVDESRPDVIKVLITGPEGTPYSNGCFIFDIFLNSNYNQSPPNVKTMTTKGGRYRLNPNLYGDGKVIISIQSMILCQEPYLNEPGWSKMSGTPESKAYNLNVRRMVVDDAMIGSIKNPNPAFADVIKTHFRLKSQVIKDQLDQWLQEDDGQALRPDNPGGAVGQAKVGNGQDSMLARNVEELKRLLDELAIEPEIENQESG